MAGQQPESNPLPTGYLTAAHTTCALCKTSTILQTILRVMGTLRKRKKTATTELNSSLENNFRKTKILEIESVRTVWHETSRGKIEILSSKMISIETKSYWQGSFRKKVWIFGLTSVFRFSVAYSIPRLPPHVLLSTPFTWEMKGGNKIFGGCPELIKSSKVEKSKECHVDDLRILKSNDLNIDIWCRQQEQFSKIIYCSQSYDSSLLTRVFTMNFDGRENHSFACKSMFFLIQKNAINFSEIVKSIQ